MEFKLKETLKDGNNFNYELIEGNSVVGLSQIRIKPSKGASMPEGFESNMSYEILSEFRGKGYGGKLFSLALEKLFELGVKEPIITCRDANIPSMKIIELSGGTLVNQKNKETGKEKGELMNKYVFKR
jgi:predicted acetyltransferase